ncbi:MAG: chloride channel protein [Bifidobacterium sp.]|jgi:H+/Cl- antiporter ClcA|nr:chloride channel protein [Bifidobacterium sp.]MCI1865199.1 chloride channel protein [Bifidobacterium sp.]
MSMRFDVRRAGWLVAAVVLLGSIIGVGAGLLTLLLYGVEHIALGFVEIPSRPGPYSVAPFRRVLSVVGVAFAASVAWWLLRSRTAKVPSVAKAVSGERMPLWQTIVHVSLQILIVGSGASIGREVAPRELGAMLAQRFGALMHLKAKDVRLVVAAAAGAGLAGVYDAPLAGMFFAVEILLADAAIETVGLSLGMSAVAAYVASLIKGDHAFYVLSGLQAGNTPSLTLFACVGGIVCGVAGALFRRGSQWAEGNKPHGVSIMWLMPAAAAFTGVAAIWLPQVMGNGRAAAEFAFGITGRASCTTILILVVLFVVKASATLLTIRSGASGGVLQPGISLGALLGAALGLPWIMAFPGDSVAACAVIGAAALLSASQKAPLMAMCLVLELTGVPSVFFVPVCVAVAVSSLVSLWMAPVLSRTQRKTARSVVSPR